MYTNKNKNCDIFHKHLISNYIMWLLPFKFWIKFECNQKGKRCSHSLCLYPMLKHYHEMVPKHLFRFNMSCYNCKNFRGKGCSIESQNIIKIHQNAFLLSNHNLVRSSKVLKIRKMFLMFWCCNVKMIKILNFDDQFWWSDFWWSDQW